MNDVEGGLKRTLVFYETKSHFQNDNADVTNGFCALDFHSATTKSCLVSYKKRCFVHWLKNIKILKIQNWIWWIYFEIFIIFSLKNMSL